jgi:hypothetical protein
MTRFPLPSPATHNEIVGHETPANQLPGSTSHRFQVVAPPVGFVEVKTLPPASTATQSLAEGHDTDCIWVVAPRGGALSIDTGADHFSVASVVLAEVGGPIKPASPKTDGASQRTARPRNISAL